MSLVSVHAEHYTPQSRPLMISTKFAWGKKCNTWWGWDEWVASQKWIPKWLRDKQIHPHFRPFDVWWQLSQSKLCSIRHVWHNDAVALGWWGGGGWDLNTQLKGLNVKEVWATKKSQMQFLVICHHLCFVNPVQFLDTRTKMGFILV